MEAKFKWWFADVATRRYGHRNDWKDADGSWHHVRVNVEEVREGGVVLLLAGMHEQVVGLAPADLAAGLRNLLARVAKAGAIKVGEQEELFAKFVDRLPRTVRESGELVWIPHEKVPRGDPAYLADLKRGVAVIASGEVVGNCQYPTRVVIVMRRADAEAGGWLTRATPVPGTVEVYWPGGVK